MTNKRAKQLAIERITSRLNWGNVVSAETHSILRASYKSYKYVHTLLVRSSCLVEQRWYSISKPMTWRKFCRSMLFFRCVCVSLTLLDNYYFRILWDSRNPPPLIIALLIEHATASSVLEITVVQLRSLIIIILSKCSVIDVAAPKNDVSHNCVFVWESRIVVGCKILNRKYQWICFESA